jgi:hypothetical protein
VSILQKDNHPIFRRVVLKSLLALIGVWLSLVPNSNFILFLATPRLMDPPQFSVGKAKEVCKALRDDGRSEVVFRISKEISEQLLTAKKQGDKAQINACEWCRNFFKSLSVACRASKQSLVQKENTKGKSIKHNSVTEGAANLSPARANAPSLITIHLLSELFTELEISTRPYRRGLVAKVNEDNFNQDQINNTVINNKAEAGYQFAHSVVNEKGEAQVVSDVGAYTVFMLHTAFKRANGFSPAEQEYFRILSQYLLSPFEARIGAFSKTKVVTSNVEKGAESLFE